MSHMLTRRRGSVMMISLGVIVVVTTLGATLMIRSLGEHGLSQRHAARDRKSVV